MYSIRQIGTGFPAADRMSSVLSSLILSALIVFVLLFTYRSGAVAEVQNQGGNPVANVIAFDGRFIAYDNGTVKDTKTGLMWAAKDGGKAIDEADFKTYFKNYRAGGYDDWRVPTVDEIKTIYDPAGKKHISCVTDLIHVSDEWVWALGDKEFALGYSFFHGGSEGYAVKGDPGNLERLDYLLVCRALPVRGGR